MNRLPVPVGASWHQAMYGEVYQTTLRVRMKRAELKYSETYIGNFNGMSHYLIKDRLHQSLLEDFWRYLGAA